MPAQRKATPKDAASSANLGFEASPDDFNALRAGIRRWLAGL
jgi:hypothetical protein